MQHEGFKMGRIFGITIRVAWSWLVIFALVTFNLVFAFGNMHPDWSTLLRWTVAVVTALLFFASVLVHELAHSLVAKAQGIPIHNITLFIFGGVAHIQEEPKSPGAEFVMALLGPVTSIVLGSALLFFTLLVSGGLRLMQQPEAVLAQFGPLTTTTAWLGSINIILGIFNLIPGFPLDGGRMLRSILWAITGNLRRATWWASFAGRAIAWLMIMSGIAMAFGAQIPIFGQGLADGLWLAFIGWFLHNAAVSSYQRVLIEDVLEGVTVGQMMQAQPPTVPPDVTIADLVNDYLMRYDTNAFPVVEDDILQGIICLHDVRSVAETERQRLTVRDVMTPRAQIDVIEEDSEASQALQKLAHREVRQLPVVDSDRLIGLLRRQDMMRWLQLKSDVTMDNL